MPTGAHSIRSRPSSGSALRSVGGGGITSDQIGPGRLDGVGEPDARCGPATARSTAFAWPLPGVGTVQVVAAQVDVVSTRAARRVDAARSRSRVIGELLNPPAPNATSRRAVAESGHLRAGDGIGPVLHRDRDRAPRVPAGIVGRVGDLVLQRRVDGRGAGSDVDGEGGAVGARLDR